MTVDQLVSRLENGERAALARLLTFIDNNNPRAERVLECLHERTGNARIIGVTGPPGAGKSTLTNALIAAFREGGKTVGVIAVDPSSALTGGATLGDRIRMLDTYDDDGVYIRSMATRGQYGGLSMATSRATQALDAFGFDVIILETVGVGQDEVDIASAADTVMLVQVPGLGDSIQTIKAGILEIADIIVVNKSELPEARTLQRDLRAMLRYRDRGGWVPPVVPTVSTTGEGIEDLLQEIDRHQAHMMATGEGVLRRRRRVSAEVSRLARHTVEARISDYLSGVAGNALIDRVERREMSPHAASRAVLKALQELDSREDRVD